MDWSLPFSSCTVERRNAAEQGLIRMISGHPFRQSNNDGVGEGRPREARAKTFPMLPDRPLRETSSTPDVIS